MDIENAENLIVQHKIISFKKGVESSNEDHQLWTGKNITSLYQKKDILLGKLIEDKIWSPSLQEDRDIIIYLPEAYDQSKSYPVIYFADGKNVKEYANYVELLIDEKKISEIILVGIHSGVTPKEDKADYSKNKRALEYLYGFTKYFPTADSTRFKKHLVFFCEEVVDYISNTISENTAERTLFGISNGSSFSIFASIQHPTLYTNIISLSNGWGIDYENLVVPDEFPTFYIAAGSLEENFYLTSKDWADFLEKNNKEHYFNKAISGHDDVMWKQEFLKTIEKM